MKITYHITPRQVGKSTCAKSKLFEDNQSTLLVIPMYSYKDYYPKSFKNKIISIKDIENNLCGRSVNLIFDECQPTNTMLLHIYPNIKDSITIYNTPQKTYPKYLFTILKSFKDSLGHTSLPTFLKVVLEAEHEKLFIKYNISKDDIKKLIIEMWDDILTNSQVNFVDWLKEGIVHPKQNNVISKSQYELEYLCKYLVNDDKYWERRVKKYDTISFRNECFNFPEPE